MAKRRHSALGKRLIASAKEMVAHAKGELKLEEYEVKLPPHVDVIAIRHRLRLCQTEFARRFRFTPHAQQDSAAVAKSRLDAVNQKIYTMM
jgi:DNA-binding transcriptional regulator YiaG